VSIGKVCGTGLADGILGSFLYYSNSNKKWIVRCMSEDKKVAIYEVGKFEENVFCPE